MCWFHASSSKNFYVNYIVQVLFQASVSYITGISRLLLSLFVSQENFLAQAAKYAQISELSKRVAEWEEKITPKLLEEVSVVASMVFMLIFILRVII